MTVNRCAFRQGFFVITYAVFIEEGLVDEVFINQHPRNTCHQCGIGARTNRDPLVFAACGGVGVARIDNDHPCVRAFACLFKVVSDPAAAHARFCRIIAEHHHQFGVFDI